MYVQYSMLYSPLGPETSCMQRHQRASLRDIVLQVGICYTACYLMPACSMLKHLLSGPRVKTESIIMQYIRTYVRTGAPAERAITIVSHPFLLWVPSDPAFPIVGRVSISRYGVTAVQVRRALRYAYRSGRQSLGRGKAFVTDAPLLLYVWYFHCRLHHITYETIISRWRQGVRCVRLARCVVEVARASTVGVSNGDPHPLHPYVRAGRTRRSCAPPPPRNTTGSPPPHAPPQAGPRKTRWAF